MTDLWLVPLIAIALTQAAVVATSVYFHRALAHRALVVHPVADVVFRTILWLTTGQRRRAWVAVHRKHHAFTDREGDPHSPRLLGLWCVQLLNAYYYQREARNPQTIQTFAPDLPEDRLDRLIFSRGLVGVALGTALLCLLVGVGPGLIAAATHAVLYVGLLAPLINGVGHWRGAQNFANTAYNSRVLAWVTGGESLHNNHHAAPRAPKFSVRRAEFDPSWPIIRALAALRLVVVVGPHLRLSDERLSHGAGGRLWSGVQAASERSRMNGRPSATSATAATADLARARGHRREEPPREGAAGAATDV